MIRNLYEFLILFTASVPGIYIIFMFFITLIPGVYIAFQKNFLYTLNQRYNFFIIRLFFTVPVLVFFNFFLSILIDILFYFLLPSISSFFFSFFGYSSIFLISIVFNFLLILYFSNIFPEDDSEIFHRDEVRCELFIYFPVSRIRGGKDYGTNYEIINKKRKAGKLMIQKQINDLVIKTEDLCENPIGITNFGEFIITKKAFNIFSEFHLSGFILRPAKKFTGSFLFPSSESTNDVLQLVTTSIMPPLTFPTEFQKDVYLGSFFVRDSKYYYNQSAIKNIYDFNQTIEYFGSNSSFS